MAFNLPSGSNNLTASLFNKQYKFTSSLSVWEMEQITASRLENMLNVRDGGLAVGYGLKYDAGAGEWEGAVKPATGLTDIALASSSIDSNYSRSIFEVTKTEGAGFTQTIEPSVHILPGETGSYRRFFTGSSEILLVSVSNADVAGFTEIAASASLFTGDQWAKYLNFDNNTDLLSVTMSDDSTYYSASLGIFSTIDTVNGRYADAAGNINLSLIETITGPNAARPASAKDGVSYVVVDDPDPNLNGTTYVYDLDNTNWVNITPTSFDADDRLFVRTAGDTMEGRLFLATNPPESGSDMATLDYINSFSSSLNVNQGLQGFNYYKSTNQNIVGSGGGAYRNLTWDVEEFNETSGSLLGGNTYYEVGPNTQQMIFDAGVVLSQNNTNGRRMRLLRQRAGGGSDTLAATSDWGTINSQHAQQVHSGLVKVTPGDRIYVQQTSAPTVNALGGQNVATFFRGYIAQPPEPLGVQFVSVGSGLNGGGSTDPVTMSVNEKIARTGSNTFDGRLDITGSFTSTGDITLRALQVNATASITGSTSFRGQVIAQGLQEYVNDIEAAANGIPINGLYRNGNRVLIRSL
jgi:hypothetical protein